MYSLVRRFQNTDLGLQFAWLNMYTDETVVGDVQFELASVLYNIGALHAELGGLDVRSNDKAMKEACTHFQCAAWAFEQVRDNPQGNKSKDLSHDFLSFLVHIMMAQAQECILEKSMLDNKKSSITAKVAAQVCDYYDSAQLVLSFANASSLGNNAIMDMVGSRLFKEWKTFILLKISYYHAICALFMGMNSEEQQKMGERIAWYKIADEKLADAMKKAKIVDKVAITNGVSFLYDYIKGKLDNAQRENDLVYHEIVPSSDKLTAVKGVSLVKSIPFSVADPDVIGADIFKRLVPIEAHEVASLYSERKDALLRETRIKIDAKNQELEAYLSSLNLSLDTLRPKVVEVPDELIEICAAMSVNDKPAEAAKEALQKLSDRSKEVGAIVSEAKLELKQEQIAQEEHQILYGKKRAANPVAEVAKELTKYADAFAKACQSDEQLRKTFEEHYEDIVALSDPNGKSLRTVLPSFGDIPVDDENVKELETLLNKIEEMKKQRVMFEKQLREAVQKDDVMSAVLTHSRDEIKPIFEKELQKFEKHTHLLDQNLAAQENILSALTKANARYAETRKAVSERQKQRDERIQRLLLSYEEFQNVLSNSEKGIAFYEKFKDVLIQTQTRIKNVIRAQQQERAVVKPPPPTPMPMNRPTTAPTAVPATSTAWPRGHPPQQSPQPYAQQHAAWPQYSTATATAQPVSGYVPTQAPTAAPATWAGYGPAQPQQNPSPYTGWPQYSTAAATTAGYNPSTYAQPYAQPQSTAWTQWQGAQTATTTNTATTAANLWAEQAPPSLPPPLSPQQAPPPSHPPL